MTAGLCMSASFPNRRRYKATADFVVICSETEQPYRICEGDDLWAIVPEDEAALVTVYLDETNELWAEHVAFVAHTKPNGSD